MVSVTEELHLKPSFSERASPGLERRRHGARAVPGITGVRRRSDGRAPAQRRVRDTQRSGDGGGARAAVPRQARAGRSVGTRLIVSLAMGEQGLSRCRRSRPRSPYHHRAELVNAQISRGSTQSTQFRLSFVMKNLIHIKSLVARDSTLVTFHTFVIYYVSYKGLIQ